MTSTHGMGGSVAYDQQLLDRVFADLDDLLAAERPVACESRSTCLDCGGTQLSYAGSGTSHPGSLVCDCCGVVQPGIVFYETMYGKDVSHKSSNYKRIHHWHERISQLMLMESQIPADHMVAIAEKLLDGTHSVMSKDTIRSVLRSLGMQVYIEKWLQIIERCTGVMPPYPGPIVLQRLDTLFLDLQPLLDVDLHP